MKRGFTLVELLVTITIIGILSSIGFSTFSTAQRKARDARRKNNLDAISKALETYYNDHSLYPADNNTGKIKGCIPVTTLEVCNPNEPFQHADTNPDTIYLISLPDDPDPSQDYYYDSISGNKAYKLYARLENLEDPSVHDYTGTDCGAGIVCNYGISSSNTTP